MPHGRTSVGAPERKESSRLVLLLSACGSPTDHRSGSGTRVGNICQGTRLGSSAGRGGRERRNANSPRPESSCAYDDDRLRLPPISPARNSKAGKKELMGRRLSQLCPPYATPSSNSSLDYRRSDARIVEQSSARPRGQI